MTDKREAPASLEQKLVGAFRGHHARRRARRRRTQTGAIAILAVAALFAAVSFVRLRPKEPGRPAIPATAVVAQADAPRAVIASPSVAAIHKRRHHAAPVPAGLATEVRQEEVTTDFLPLDPAGSSAPASGEIIRVEMPRSTLALFGLPFNTRRASVPVQADVLLGEDGMAHAVRFVTTTSSETPTGR
jgi:hypothetical protein